MQRRRSRRASLRALRALGVLGMATAALLIAGQLAAVGHYVFVAHYLCSEHATMHHGHGPRLAPEASAPGPSSVRAVIETEHGVHDTCAFPARERQALETPAAGSAPTPAALGRAATAIARHDAVLPPVPLLSQAPKQSPPDAVREG